MRITVQHALKVPDAEQYSSRQHSVAMELDVPADIVSQGKDAIREYVAKVTAEVRSYVEEALAGIRVEQQEREPVEPAPAAVRTPRGAPNGNGHHRPPSNGRASPRIAARARASGNGHANSGEAASIKQVNFIRSLAADAGYSAAQLEYVTEEVIGSRKPLSSLTKKEASAVIETLRGGQQ